MLETRIQSLGREDPLEREMATHSSTLAWIIPWTEEPGRLQGGEGKREKEKGKNFGVKQSSVQISAKLLTWLCSVRQVP